MAGSRRFTHPAVVILGGFAGAITVGAILLCLPIAAESREPTDFADALFTATSAVTVTGLVVLDTPEHWSTFGEVVIMLLFQTGGVGIMTFATLLAALISRRLGFGLRLIAQAETQSLQLSDVRRVVVRVVLFVFTCEAVATILLAIRFIWVYHESVGTALYDAVFHGISAFNNAGFSLNSDSLMKYASDPWVIMTIGITVIVGAMGFPVMFELLRSWRRPGTWSVVTRITVGITAALLVLGTLVFTLLEWSNPKTLGPLADPLKVMNGFFQSLTCRSAGFNSVDTGALKPESLLFSDILMFIGGGSSSTAGGIKVTTFGLLAFVIWAELRGRSHVNVGWRRIPESTQRQALTIVLLAVGMVALGSAILLSTTDHSLDQVLFEVISGGLTVGLSTGITPELGTVGQYLITFLMYLGRVGPLLVGSTLALRQRGRAFELPLERPVVG